jgi:Cell division septal protein
MPKKKLLAYPFIEGVSLEKMLPDTLFVDCVMRKPLLELADYEQVAIDEEGFIFPLTYFYTPKRLPKVYLGLGPSPLKFNTHTLKLDGEEMRLILTLLKKVPNVKIIDLSLLNAESLGKEEIILTLRDNRFVRLPKLDWEEAFSHLDKIPPSYKEVDLRYSKLTLVR